METELLKLYCMTAAVLLNEAQLEPELVARIVAANEKVKRPLLQQAPISTIAYKVFWQLLFTDVESAVKTHGLTS